MTHPTDTNWRCQRCGSLLGLRREGKLHLKYKSALFIVEGDVLAICRRCSQHNQTRTFEAWPESDDGQVMRGVEA